MPPNPPDPIMHFKVALVTLAALTLAAIQAAWTLAVTAAGDGGTIETVIPAAALTATSGALVWVVKQVVSGNLVHRDPAAATTKLAEALQQSNKIAERALERENVYAKLVLHRATGTNDD